MNLSIIVKNYKGKVCNMYQDERQHHHLIRTGYGAHPVGDDEDGFVFYEPG